MTKLFSRFATVLADLSGKLGPSWPLLRSSSFGRHPGHLRLLGDVAACHQYLDNDHNVSDGLRLQNSQNRDGKALQAKLDELILTSQAQNKFVGIEKLEEQELRDMSKKLAEKAECVEDVAEEKAEAGGRPPSAKSPWRSQRATGPGKLTENALKSALRLGVSTYEN